jgi:hypothetical protein
MTYDRDRYRDEALKVRDDAKWTARKFVPLGIAFLLFALVGFWILRVASQPARIIEKVTDADNVISNYEEFQSIHNAAVKLDRDLCNLRAVPDADPMFAQFSKGATHHSRSKANLDRWIEEYNAKSKMITRSAWKAKCAPLSAHHGGLLSCYEGGAQMKKRLIRARRTCAVHLRRRLRLR